MLSDACWKAHKATLAARAPFTDFEYSVAFPGTQERWLSISGAPLFDTTNTFTGYRGIGIGIGRDITERKEAEQKSGTWRCTTPSLGCQTGPCCRTD